jgi:hypothetical protein
MLLSVPMMKKLILVAALAVPALVGCKKGGAAAGDCAGATASAMKMAEGSMAAMPPEAQEMMKKAMGPMSAMMTKVCVDGKWSAAVTDCMKAAKDEKAGKACEAKLTDAQRTAMNAASKAMQDDMMKAMTPPTPPAMDGSGSAAPAMDGSGSAAPAMDGSGSAAPAMDGSAAPAAGSAAPAAADGSAAPAPAAH